MLPSVRNALRRAARSRPGQLALAAWNRSFAWRRAFLLELDRPARGLPARRAAFPAGYALRRAGRADAAECSRVARVPVAEVLRRHDAGDACYVVARGPQIATVLWVHDGPFYVRGLGYAHAGAAGEKYVYGVVTDPAARRQGLYRSAVEELGARLFSEGAPRLVRIVEARNGPVLRTLARLGHRRARTIECVVVAGLRRTVVTPLERAGDRERSWRLRPPRELFVI